MLGILQTLQQTTDTAGRLLLKGSHLVTHAGQSLPLDKALETLDPGLVRRHLGLKVSPEFPWIAGRHLQARTGF